jgi:RND family efflux transporter MFP subunit
MRSVYGWIAAVVVLGVGAAGTWAVLSLEDDPSERYRLAATELADVTQTLSTNGTVDFVNRSDVSFGVGGSLAELTVSPGDQVSAGQRLGSLDDARLLAEVESAEAELATAEATLETDEQRQQDAVDSQPEEEPAPELKPQQDAVRAARTAAGEAIATAKQTLAAQRKACAAPTTETTTACADALAATMSTQDKVAAAQEVLQRKLDELTEAMARSSTEDARQAEQPQGESTPTAATIAADQAAVDRAKTALLAAEHDLAEATLTAPIAGTVASVTATVGDEVTAADPVLVLIGQGAALVETTVPVERIADIEVGQQATVTPTGSATAVEGAVTRIGRLLDQTADAPAYPVTITVEQPPTTMPSGSLAAVEIVVDTVRDVLTVPTSAITRGDQPTVTVLDGTQSAKRQVELGAIGPVRTEIREGLDRGDQVVLADLALPLPTSGTQNQNGPGGIMVVGPRRQLPR